VPCRVAGGPEFRNVNGTPRIRPTVEGSHQNSSPDIELRQEAAFSNDVEKSDGIAH
jgi:hypothetical protein